MARRNEDGLYAVKKLRSQREAKRFLKDYMYRPAAMLRLRALLGDVGLLHPPGKTLDLKTLPALELIEQVARHIVSERVVVARQIDRTNAPSAFDDKKDEPPPAPGPGPAPGKKNLTWIEFKVVEDASGQPLSPVRLTIKTPDGNEAFHTTNSEGLIRIEEIDEGTCDAKCDLKNAKLSDTLVFVKVGDADVDKAPTGEKKRQSATLRIANVEEHKVRSGQTLAGLARKAEMTWQNLAKFNWGTESPDEINKYLRSEVGCRKKTADKKNYVFDDADNPGIVRIPTQWKETGLATARTHVIRVRYPGPVGSSFIFSI